MRDRALAKAAYLLLSMTVIFPLICFYSGRASTAEAQPMPSYGAAVTYFYKNPKPERVAEILAAFNTSPQSANPRDQPAMEGFLAGAFQRFPNSIGTMIPPGLLPASTWVTAVALHLAGDDSEAKPLFDRLVANGAPPPNFELLPRSLDSLVPKGAADFDVLWGASFATGDPRYCSKILAGFASVADTGGNAPVMVMIIKFYFSGPHQGSLKWLFDKYGTQNAMELIIWSSALWSLHSNAQQHAFVRTMVDNYIKAHPGQPAAAALLAL
jgi:hypothetical protein